MLAFIEFLANRFVLMYNVELILLRLVFHRTTDSAFCGLMNSTRKKYSLQW
jgi:hypothetical protein